VKAESVSASAKRADKGTRIGRGSLRALVPVLARWIDTLPGGAWYATRARPDIDWSSQEAKNNVVSVLVVDAQARHARKSRAARADGFKAHIVVKPDTGLVTDTMITMAAGPASSDATAGLPCPISRRKRHDPSCDCTPTRTAIITLDGLRFSPWR